MTCLGYRGVLLLSATSPFPTPSHLIELLVICVFPAGTSQVSFLHVHSLFNGYFFLLLLLDIDLVKFLLCL